MPAMCFLPGQGWRDEEVLKDWMIPASLLDRVCFSFYLSFIFFYLRQLWSGTCSIDQAGLELETRLPLIIHCWD